MDVVSLIGSICAVLLVLAIIVTFWTILWKFCLFKFPLIQAIVSGEPKSSEEEAPTAQITAAQAQKEREERIAKRRTRKAE